MLYKVLSFISLLFTIGTAVRGSPTASIGDDLVLDGAWDRGIDRNYAETVAVPEAGTKVANDAAGTMWYRRTISLPEGDWTTAVLQLNGVRFAPTVYVDGRKIGESDGGMVPLRFALHGPGVVPGGTITLEIALKTLSELASKEGISLPASYRDRLDLTNGFSDNATLHFSGDAQISRVVPETDFSKRRLCAHWEIEGAGGITVDAALLDTAGKTLSKAMTVSAALSGNSELALRHECRPWTLSEPRTYRIRVTVRQGSRIEDIREITWALREFKTEGSRFLLNGEPIQLRGGSFDWNTWLSQPQTRGLAFDPAWFDANVLLRLKSLGANFIRFRLGFPPESFLDLCDRKGILVQVEWPFSSGGRTPRQDIALHHPSLVLVEPWNESDNGELATARDAEKARRLRAAESGPLVIASNPDDPESWTAFAAALSPLSISLDVAGQNYARGKTATVPLAFFNDTNGDRTLSATVRVVSEDEGGQTLFDQRVRQSVPAHDRRTVQVRVKIPDETGAWRFEAQLNTPVPGVTQPIVSSWQFKTAPEAGIYSFVH